MTFSPEQIAALEAPLSRSVVKRNPKGFDYVEAWHSIAEANRIFGFDAWSRETVEMRLLGEPRLFGEKWRVGYFAKVRITVGQIVREGCGFGSGIHPDVDQAHEGALKEAESDAMKRALMTFGNPFGLALYDKEQANVVAEPPPLKPEETGLFVACRAAIDLADDQDGKRGLELWAKDNAPSMANMEKEYPAIYTAVRRYYAGKLQSHKQAAAA